MRVSGSICNCSDRAEQLQLRYLELERNPKMLGSDFPMGTFSDVQMVMVNEALDMPPLIWHGSS